MAFGGWIFVDKQKKQQTQIPKKIHYVWFGYDEVPENVKASIDSWKKYMPDYEIKRWNEKNCDVKANPYIRNLMANKEYSYAADWCRAVALYEEGGIYLDTDMKMNAPVDDLLTKPLIFTFQYSEEVSAGILAATIKHPLLKNIIDFLNQKTDMEKINGPTLWTKIFDEYKKNHNDYIIYPANMLMYDFGGGENRTFHQYAGGFHSFTYCNGYYRFFQKYFLNERGYCLSGNCSEDGGEWILPEADWRFYIVRYRKEKCFYADDKVVRGNYQIVKENNVDVLTLSYDNGDKKVYHCIGRNCRIVD